MTPWIGKRKTRVYPRIGPEQRSRVPLVQSGFTANRPLPVNASVSAVKV